MVAIFKKKSRWLQTIVLFDLKQWLTMSRYWHFIYIFGPSCFKYITLFFLFFHKVLAAIFGSHLEFYGQDSPKTQEIPFYQIVDISVSKKWHLSLWSIWFYTMYITVYVFQCGVRAYFWAAMLDFKVKMVQNIVNSFYYISITFMMPELTGNYTSFAFCSVCIKRCHFFWFSM